MMSKSLFDNSINLVIICSVLLIYFITSSANHWIVCDPFDDAISLLAYSNPTGFVKKGRGNFFRDTQRVPGPKPHFALRAFTTQIGML